MNAELYIEVLQDALTRYGSPKISILEEAQFTISRLTSSLEKR